MLLLSTRKAAAAATNIGVSAFDMLREELRGRKLRQKEPGFGSQDQESTNQECRDDAPPWTARHTLGQSTAFIGKTVLVNQPAQELYKFWQDLSNLPKVMRNVESVERHGDLWQWKIAAPAGQSVALETRILESKKNELLVWESTENSQIECNGRVEFKPAPGNRGTLVQVQIHYKPPGGTLGRIIAHLFRKAPEVQARHDLKRFKMLMETGEIATSDRSKTQ